MSKLFKNFSAIVILVANVAVSTGLVITADGFVTSVISSIKTYRLEQTSKENKAALQLELASLEAQTAKLSDIHKRRQCRQPLSLPAIETSSRQHNLKISSVERLNAGPQKNTRSLIKFRVSIIGTIGNVVRFFNQIESEYQLNSEDVTIQAADEEGAQVATILTVILNE